MIWPFSISACYGIPYVYVNKTYLVKQLMKIPFVKKNYQKEMDNQWNDFSTKTQKKWEQFGTLYVEIPLNGLSYTECTDLINLYSKNTLSNLENKQFSGTIYPNALLSSGGNFIHPEILNMSSNEQLMELYSLIFKNSYLWNSLHSDEFPAANAIEYQIVKMVAEIFGGSTEDIMGIVTTGGTQSLMNAVRSYINF